MIRWAFWRIGLTHTRSHALRHAFACRLVENGSSLKEVADLLRHRSLNTTLIYAKLDTPKLGSGRTAVAGEQIMSRAHQVAAARVDDYLGRAASPWFRATLAGYAARRFATFVAVGITMAP